MSKAIQYAKATSCNFNCFNVIFFYQFVSFHNVTHLSRNHTYLNYFYHIIVIYKKNTHIRTHARTSSARSAHTYIVWQYLFQLNHIIKKIHSARTHTQALVDNFRIHFPSRSLWVVKSSRLSTSACTIWTSMVANILKHIRSSNNLCIYVTDHRRHLYPDPAALRYIAIWNSWINCSCSGVYPSQWSLSVAVIVCKSTQIGLHSMPSRPLMLFISRYLLPSVRFCSLWIVGANISAASSTINQSFNVDNPSKWRNSVQ